MRVLTLTQPWATLMALGAKTVETRSWPFHMTGSLAIAAAVKFPRDAIEFTLESEARGYLRDDGVYATPGDLPRGAIVALVWVHKTRRFPGDVDEERLLRQDMTRPAYEFEFGNYAVGRWGLYTDRSKLVRLSDPVSCRGRQRIWHADPDIAVAVYSRLTDAQREIHFPNGHPDGTPPRRR